MAKMHADEADIDADLVRRLLRAQFPHWADLPVRRLASGGTVNAIYRVGSGLKMSAERRFAVAASEARGGSRRRIRNVVTNAAR